MTDPANTPSTETTKLRVEVCLAEYRARIDEVARRHTYQLVATIFALLLISLILLVRGSGGHNVLNAALMLEYLSMSIDLITASIIFSLLGAYLLNQTAAILRIQRDIAGPIKAELVSLLGPNLLETQRTGTVDMTGKSPFSKLLSMPIHILLALGAIFSMIGFRLTSNPSESDGAALFSISYPEPGTAANVYFLFALACFAWYAWTFLKVQRTLP